MDRTYQKWIYFDNNGFTQNMDYSTMEYETPRKVQRRTPENTKKKLRSSMRCVLNHSNF